MGRGRYVAGIDVGSTKVCTVIADVSEGVGPRLLGYGWVPSLGIQRGAVVDLEEVGRSLADAIDQAERSSGQKIDSAFFSIADEHVSSFNRRGLVTVGAKPRAITQSHVTRAVESTTFALDLEPGQEVIHFVPRSFCVDHRYHVQNPVGMQGNRLEVETHVISGATTSIVNMMQAVHRHGLDIDEFVVSPLAAAEAVVTPEERHAGVMLIDIGGGTTDIVVFADGGISFTGVIAMGGNQVTSDLAIGLRVPLSTAEQVKLQTGRCTDTGMHGDETVALPSFDGGVPEDVPLVFVAEICQARVEEILEAVMDRVAASGFAAPLPGGAVLTGGGALLPGIVELARRTLDLPIRLGVPTGIAGSQEVLQNPAMAVGAGLVLWGMHNGHPEQRGRVGTGLHGAKRRLGTWFRQMAL